MTVVADSSALVASVADYGSDGRWVENVFAKENLVGSELALAEATNILRRMEISGRISRADAASAVNTPMMSVGLRYIPRGRGVCL